MRSLKIIIFRDTDKPYTMIISSKVLIGLTFGLVALISLLAFSVMGNIMLWDDDVLAETQSTVATNDAGEAGEMPIEENQRDEPGEESTDTAEGVDEDSGESGYDNMDDAAEEVPGSFDDMVDNIYMVPGGSSHEVVLLGEPFVQNNSVQVRLEVRKRTELGIREGGRLIVALVDAEGNVGSSLPRSIQYEGVQVLNPERGTRFVIARRNTYNLDFQNVDTARFSHLVLFIYDELGTQLIWRNIIPLRR